MKPLTAMTPGVRERLAAIRAQALAAGHIAPSPACAACDDTTWRQVDGRARRCDCWLEKHPSTVHGIPSFFEKTDLASFLALPGTEAAIAAARRWLKGEKDLYLAGTVGSGKTRLACSLANEATRLGRSAAFCDVATLIDEARKAEFQRSAESDPDPLHKLKRIDVLILDDVGALEKASDFTLRTLLTLYNQRLAQQRRTIWTSNKKLDELGAIFNDDRLPSRIAGAADVVWVSAGDFRVAGDRRSTL